MAWLKTKDVPEIVAPVDANDNLIGVQAVDQFDAQPFMMGENGFHRHPISVIMHEENADLRDALLARLDEIKSDSGFDSSVPVGDIIRQIVPRYAQLPSAMREVLSYQSAKSVDEFISKLKKPDEIKAPEKVAVPEPKSE